MTSSQEVTLIIHFGEEKKEQKIKVSNDFNQFKKNI